MSFRQALRIAFCVLVAANWQVAPFRLLAEDPKSRSQLTEPPAVTSSVVQAVRRLIERSHVLRPKFNDEISSRGFETFIKKIDPAKSLFLASDIQEFQPFQWKLDDLILENDISFAYIAYKRLLQRLEQFMCGH